MDKGNAIVVMNKSDYLTKAKEILYDERAFKKLIHNLTDKHEEELNKFLLQLKRNKIISPDEYKLMRRDTGSRTPETYFLVKVHKSGQPVRPIISSYNSYNYNTVKYLATLPAISQCPSYVKDSFGFARIIKENKDLSGLIYSLDVSSLFTNAITNLEKAINIAIKKIKQFHPKLTIDDDNLRELFYYCTKRTNFIFNNEHYDQINGVSMGSPIASIKKRKDSKLITYVYRKSTDTGLYLEWTGNQPRNYKINLIKCLCFHAKRMCSSNSLFKQQLEYYKKIFIANGYPCNVVKKTIRSIELSINKKQPGLNIQKLFIPFPYYGECSIVLANKIRKISQTFTTHIVFGFKAENRISSLFSRTYRCSNDNKRIAYGYSCYDCDGYYIGQTARGAEVRKEEHKLLRAWDTPKLQNITLIKFTIIIGI
ncbi:unnamed protein product [Didymodactylos carnosus]|uniref:Helix-turn-helix domain-containing protein n=1 Tax=Didymodactylos carnosus TaxID=1234261 RepID=A0A815WZ68_9BILA|nr:unnamed protein product [Didymodactylos carnosus]CAF1551833.1 unnamed protein product [Didymodactylos carnosus]CAF4235163.1 unnamed protein product [Didymodactylos carnosus]CAF4412878.1 unnamed protein product [Didymodactylos carnosus]